MHGYCNMCGKCCEAITLWVSPEEIANENTARRGADWAWAHAHFHPITHEEAFRRNPFHRMIAENEVPAYNTVHFYECDAYDKATHRCTAHEERPRICRAYPYGEQRAADWLPYSPTCDYANELSGPMKQEMIELALELKRVSAE